MAIGGSRFELLTNSVPYRPFLASAESANVSRVLFPHRFETGFTRLVRLGFQASDCAGKEVNNVASVNLRPNESQDQLLKRFRKKVAKSGILSTVRRKRWFVSKSELRRIQKKKSIRRIRRRQREEME
jgi:small subunit ribosomal protein S21